MDGLFRSSRVCRLLRADSSDRAELEGIYQHQVITFHDVRALPSVSIPVKEATIVKEFSPRPDAGLSYRIRRATCK